MSDVLELQSIDSIEEESPSLSSIASGVVNGK